MKKKPVDVGIVMVFIVFALWTLAPLIFMAISSLKVSGEIFAIPQPRDWVGFLNWFRFEPTLHHFQALFLEGQYFLYLRNSVLLTLVTTAIAVPLGFFVSYGLSRARLPGKENIFFWVITTRMAPPVVVLAPLYFLFRDLHLLQTFLGMVLAYTTFSLSFAIWLLRGFIDAIPIQLEEAARIDGLSRFRVVTNIVLPLIRPGLGACIMLVALLVWNDYLFALILGGRGMKTLAVAITELESASGIYWGQIMAGGIVLVVPMIIFGMLTRRYLVKGLTMGTLE